MTGGLDRVGIVAALNEMGARLRLSGDNPFRARAYELGAEAVEGLSDKELAERVQQKTLNDVTNVGGALAAVISDLAQSGRTELLDRLRSSAPAALLELTQVPGVTKRRARILHETLGIASVDDLVEAAELGRIREVRGFGPKTEAAILTASRAYRAQPRAIRLVDARRAAAALAGFVASQSGVERAEVAGAVRRWQETIGEIAVVGSTEEKAPADIAAVANYPPLARVERRTSDGLVGRLGNGVGARVRLAAHSRWGVAQIEETGPAGHVDGLKALARTRGVDWEAMRAADEESVYRALGLPFVPPEAREWTALPPVADFDQLIAAPDLRGAVHCHTTYSDGRHTVEEMARAADARGLHYLTITDHSASAHYAGGLTVDRLRKQWEEMARVQEVVKVRLLRGTESDILADGSLDYPDDVLEGFDVIIASIHARHRMNASDMTARVVRAMKLPLFKIWGHPLGRLILRRAPIDCDVERALDAVAASRAAIEISGDPYRLDLAPAWIPAARRRGIRFVISTDAHAAGDLDNVSYGVAMARRGGVMRTEVLNALDAAAFCSAVRPS